MNSHDKTILIVDDDPDMLTQIEMQCQTMGFNTLCADSQKAGEKLIEDTRPDLAIFDLMMENRDSGFILSYKLKKKYPDVPVIIATAVTRESGMIFGIDTEEEKSWIKADQYLEKGIRPDQLAREINKLLKV
jgi:DNA-binding response OmpR family regulator